MKKFGIALLLCVLFPVLSGAGDWSAVKRIEKSVVAPVFRDVQYNILDFGAVGDGVTDSRAAILAAVEKCSFEGGGRVVVPSGKFFVKGPVVLKSNVNLHFEYGAELLFSSDENDYLPCVLTRWEGTEVYNYSPLIYARDVINVAVSGEGVINANGVAKFVGWKAVQKADQKALRKMGDDGVPIYERVFGKGHYLRPAVVEFVSCSSVMLSDFMVKDNTFWCTHLIACENVTVRNLTVDSENYNADGCDPESCRNVIIEGCRFHAGDDGIAIKSGRDRDGWRMGQPSENIIIRNCVFDTPANGICIGSEISGGVRNVFIEDITVVTAKNAIYFKSNLDRGGYITDIFVRNVRVEHCGGCLIKFDSDYKSESLQHHPTLFRRFRLKGIDAAVVDGTAIEAIGFSDLPIEDVEIGDVSVGKAAKPSEIRNVGKFTLRNVKVGGRDLELNN